MATDENSLVNNSCIASAAYWADFNELVLQGGIFSFTNREYLYEPMESRAPRVCAMKGTGGGFSECMGILPSVHGMIYGRYPQGVLYMFPTNDDVRDFSKSRFTTLITENRLAIGRYVKSGGIGTDSAALKKVGSSFLYLRGARLNPGDEGMGGTKFSTKLTGIQVDRIVPDEIDQMDSEAIAKARGRMGNACVDGVKGRSEERYIANPSDEDRGIDLYWQQCVIPETKILTVDLRWKCAGDLKNSDKVIGFDEEHLVGSKTRRYRATEITNCDRDKMPCFKILFEDGTIITVSSHHKFLIERGRNIFWRNADKLKVGNKVLSIGTWEEERTRESGWIAGMFDGEGSLSVSYITKRQQKAPAVINFAQKIGTIINEMERVLTRRGFLYGKYVRDDNVCLLMLKGGLPEKLRFCGTFRPIRFLAKISTIYEGTSVGNDGGNTRKLKVVNIEDVGLREVVTLETKHKTFIANGLLSHNSDQREWFVKCASCGAYTCALHQFINNPEKCVGFHSNGRGYIRCSKCEKPIGNAPGKWVAGKPSVTDLDGYQWNHLASVYHDPGRILRDFTDPPEGNLGDVYRLDLGLPYSSAEDKLQKDVVLRCCGNDIMPERHDGPCAMGVDVKKVKHIVIGTRTGRDRYEIHKVAEVQSFKDVHDLAKRYNVKSDVVDIRPYEDEARQYQKSSGHKTYLCEYTDSPLQEANFNDNTGVVKAYRTGIFDASHRIITDGQIRLPRRCKAVEDFAIGCCKCVKSKETNKRTGQIVYRYRKTGDKQDDYRHALNYFLLAASGWRIGRVGAAKNRQKTAINDYARV